jgi:outer membrane biosynthesis protein TonB
MNRLQKKCLLATAGFHLLLLVILLVGPAFFSPKPKPDDLQLLDVIPANAIDAAFNSGVKNAQAARANAHRHAARAATAGGSPQPKPVVTPPTLMQQVEKFFKPAPDKLPPDDSAKPNEHVIKPDLNPVTHVAPKNTTTTTAPDASQKNAKAKALAAALKALRSNLSSGTTIDMPGDSSAAYANYASIVKSVYTQAWTPPDDTTSDDANVKVSITIANDGTVISAHIIGASGDASVDELGAENFGSRSTIAPFPDGATEKERTYIINFNLKAKRMLE